MALIAEDELSSLLECVYLLRSPENAQRLFRSLEWVETEDATPQTLAKLGNDSIVVVSHIDRKTREILGYYLGDRSRQSAKKLWARPTWCLPTRCVAYTDFWESYKTVIPSKCHRPV